MLLSSTATLLASATEETTARSTGNEEIDVSVNEEYYDRGSGISVTVVLTNLDPNSEYTLDWELCIAEYNECNLYSAWTAGGVNDPAETEGSFTITPSLSTHSETFVFTDPGDFVYGPPITGIENESYYFNALLSIQQVPLSSNKSGEFILGGEMKANSNLNDNSNVLKNTDIEFWGDVRFDYQNHYLLTYDVDCGLYENGNTIPVDTSSLENQEVWDDDFGINSDAIGFGSLTPTATSGTHHIECVVTRNLDSFVMGRIIGNDFEIIDDTANQDDASISVTVDIHHDEQYGNVTISGVDLDAGQEYTFDWIVHDNVPIPPVVLMANNHIWVEGDDGMETYVLVFHDLADTTNACITVVLSAGDTELQTVANVCWASASTADADGDGVYDKNDLCDNTPTSSVVQADGCSDSDGDGFDSNYEIDCGSNPNDVSSTPTDLDNDGTCDVLDTDSDGDGYLNADELLAGTNPLDDTSFPANRLPTCALYYSLEVDGIPVTFEGDAVIPALSGVTAQIGLDSMVPPVITIPAGSYYMTAHCIDLDGDDITVTVNGITIGPIAGEVSAGALIVIDENVSETVDVTITWTDGSDTLMTMVTINLESDAPVSSIPGFGLLLGMSAVLLAGFAARRKNEF